MSRWIQLLTLVLVGLVAAALTIGALALRTERAADGLFTQRNDARSALQQSRSEAQQAQVLDHQVATLVAANGPTDRAAIATLAQATALQRSALADWGRFENLSQSWDGAGPQGTQIDEDLGRLAGINSSALLDGGTTVGLTPKALALADTLQVQMTNAVNHIRVADITWWTSSLKRQRADLLGSLRWLELIGGAGLATLIVGNTAAARASRRREHELIRREADLAGVAVANEFEARLQRALEMSTTEERVHGVTRQALEEAVPDMKVEVLLADSSRAHFHRVIETEDGAKARCSVESPTECPAARRGEVLTFPSSRALDACPYLKDLDQVGSCSSVCIPVSVSGLTIGVVHAAGTHGELPAPRPLALLELISRRASDRIGMMRAFARTEVQASTDPLTGLANRRALEDEVVKFARTATPFAVAYGDLDRFKMLNDVHGHGAGDQALRIFAGVLREHLRPGDLAGRYGGEEFVLVLPNCGTDEASAVLERIRERLAAVLSEATGPSFTVSFGLAPAQVGLTFDVLVGQADRALLEAKVLGRDRVVVFGEESPLSDEDLRPAEMGSAY